MKNAGISELILNKEFIFKFDNGGMCAAGLIRKIDSASKIMKRIKQALKNRLEEKYAITALQDIENQLVERHDEIFSHNKSDYTNNPREDEQKSNYLKRVTELKKEREETNFTYELWQASVQERYKKVREVTERNFPDAWPLLQFCLAVKSILNIDGCTLPFMGVILAIPSSMKTLVIQLFRNYPNSLYSDNFTPNSFESHNAALSEEELRKVDLLPKLANKFFLTPELAPIFTTNEDELRKSLGIITRILDGHGLETDSGAQGHRKYGNIFFVWLGAAVEIPYRVWLLLGTLGHKIYMFRPLIREKSLQELQKIAKENDFQKRFKETEDSLIEYLIAFDAVPIDGNIRTDDNGITKVKWNQEKRDEQDKAIACLAQVANLLKRLRGTVYVSKSKAGTGRYNSKSGSDVNNDKAGNKNDQENQDCNFLNDSESDYDTDYPVIEDPSRAVVLLRNLALANAISQGRNFINFDDMPLVINMALSTTTRARSELINLLLENDGELTTSTIVRESKISSPFAKKTMRELAALGVVDITPVARYDNSELKITLTKEYSWFKEEQFKELLNRDKIVSNDSINGSTSIVSRNSFDTGQSQTNELSDKNNEKDTGSRQSSPDSRDNEASQSQFKIKSTTERHKKILEECDSTSDYNSDHNQLNHNGNFDSNNNQREPESKLNNNKEFETSSNNVNNCDKSTGLGEKNNVPLWGSESFQHVTLSHDNTQSKIIKKGNNQDSTQRLPILDRILEEIRKANGSVVSVATVLEFLHRQFEFVRIYLGNKLTQRENRKVRQLYLDIIHTNDIEVVKHKPQLIVRWINCEKSGDNSGSVP
jgi:hypothetical protein